MVFRREIGLRMGGTGLGLGRGRNFWGDFGRRGRMGGPIAGGPGGICRCPSCGYQAPQLRGYPCMDLECPNCGTRMMRG